MLLHSIAGAPLSWWIAFHVVVLLLLLADAALPVASSDGRKTALALFSSVFIASLALGFAFWLNARQGREPALEFLSGYVVETSLSIDNLFVFLLLFRGFGLGLRDQRRALLWGVAGAVVLRALCIALGITLLKRLSWMEFLFGAFLLVTAVQLLREDPDRQEASPSWLLRLRRRSSSLFWVILAVELTDLLFAFDSIPAVLAISHDPFVVYTSNVAAILGLRSLYFVLASLLDRMRFLHYGLAVLLAFVGAKMLIGRWIQIPVAATLATLAAILLVTAAASAWFPASTHSCD
jgi:tellurite resistance protein TerC